VSRGTRAHEPVSGSDPEQLGEGWVLADGNRQRREGALPGRVVARQVAAIADLADDDLMLLAQWGRKENTNSPAQENA